MTPNFQLATQLITDVCHLPFHCLNTEKDMERSIQIFQNPYAVKTLVLHSLKNQMFYFCYLKGNIENTV